jgi:small subunit ribosomal protein S21
MLIIDVKNGNIEQALKKYKSKVAKTKQIQKLRGKQAFVKPSVERRDEVRKATYVQSLKTQAEKES